MNRTFRVFVSSTFADFQHERRALQDEVFPKLRDYSRLQGARFEGVDLRWGISEAAVQDQRTVDVCLEEIRRAQSISPKPNFIVLLGDRYGWRALPSTIAASEFQSLHGALTTRDRAIVDKHYRYDGNAIPPVYYLSSCDESNDGAWDRERLAAALRAATEAVGLRSRSASSTSPRSRTGRSVRAFRAEGSGPGEWLSRPRRLPGPGDAGRARLGPNMPAAYRSDRVLPEVPLKREVEWVRMQIGGPQGIAEEVIAS